MTVERPRRHAQHAVVRHLIGIFRNPDIQIIRDLIYLAFGQVSAKIVGFVLFAYLARVLEPSEYGALETLLAIVGFAALVVDFGLGSAAVRHRAQDEPDRDTVIGIVPALRMLLAVPCMLGMWIAVLFVTDDPVVRSLGGLFALSLVFHAWKQEWLLQSLELLRVVALAQFLRVALMAAIVMATVKGSEDLAWVGIAEVVTFAALSAVYLLVQLRFGFGIRLNLERTVAGPLMRQALPLGLNTAVWGLIQNVPMLLVGLFGGLEQAAYLAAAQRLTTSLQSVSYVYHFNMFAALTRRFQRGKEQLQKLSLASIRVVAWASIGPAAICAAYAGDILGVIFGANYVTAGPVLAVIIFIVPIQILSGHYRWALTAAGETRSVLWSGLAGAAVSALCSAALAPLIGAMGGAMAAVAAGLTIWWVSSYECRKLGLPLPILSRIGLPVVASAVSMLPAFVLPALPLAAGLSLSAAIYGALALILDRKRIYPDLRHLAYAKEGTR